eukprot:CAMPEP_0176064482 /NCGR_PEP_ID=MMETSP0120_2-20121206/32161_1 /TAXON_ID=160619 /ORGANISM="Kryptoperidinium foliaceum, Strain CCMP 1326" /LENGTH=123 /DNA_ID=CAMNT_0017398055 /DNA_START=51 /DNA_END=422 /DNA_ORIENTATION=-
MMPVWRRWLFAAFALMALAATGSAAEEDAEADGDEGEADGDDVKSMLEMADQDGDGKLTFDELFKAGSEVDEEGAPDEEEQAEFKAELSKHFQAADKDGDGFLAGDELRELLQLFESDHAGEL